MVEADAEAWLQDEGSTEDRELGDACAAMASAARTFVEARALLNQVKDARGYFPVVGLGAWQPGQVMAPPQKTSKGKGKAAPKGKKGKGGSKPKAAPGKGKPGARQPWGGGGPDPKNRAAAFSGKCLLCGQLGHKAHECTNRGNDGQANLKRARAMGTAFVGSVSSQEESVADADMTSFCMESCRGFGLLDGGASTSVGGVDQLQTLQDALLSEGLDVGVAPATRRFAFAGGDEATAGSQCVLPLAGLQRSIRIHVIDRPSPILLGVDVLESLGLVIDYRRNSVYSHALSRSLPATRLKSGHLALNLVSLIQADTAATAATATAATGTEENNLNPSTPTSSTPAAAKESGDQVLTSSGPAEVTQPAASQ